MKTRAKTATSDRIRVGWAVAIAAATTSRVAYAFLQPGPSGYDAFAHIAYVLFLDTYQSVPLADQGWSYFHPPVHYALGWLLAQWGSGDVLIRGLSLLSGAASLGVAGLAADVTGRALGKKTPFPLLAFVSVAFLPPHLYSSPMPGNELTATFFGGAAVALFLANTGRKAPSRGRDAGVGTLAGLALLTKFSGLIPLLAILAALTWQYLVSRTTTREFAIRVGIIAGLAFGLSAPYYARNTVEFGTPFAMSRTFPLVAAIENEQPPGERSLVDFIQVPTRLFSDPRPMSDHLVHSVWGTVYARTWAEKVADPDLRRALVLAGVIPTIVILLGFVRSLQAIRRERDALIDVTLVLLAMGSVAAFAIFAWRVPIFSALKASYMLNLSLPVGLFIARAAANPPLLWNGARRWLIPSLVVATSVFVTLAYMPRLPREPKNPAMGVVHAHFGEYDAARETLIGSYERSKQSVLRAQARETGSLLSIQEALAAIELQAGRPQAARELYLELTRKERPNSPIVAPTDQLLSSAAVASALAGAEIEAFGLLDAAQRSGDFAEALVNRGALWAKRGNLERAQSDLRRAIALNPTLAAAHANLAWVLDHRQETAGARASRKQADELSQQTPRDFPYGVGNGIGLGARRFLLVFEGDALSLHRPGRTRR
ncbi:tetratricopeptide repeat protein [Myxococcota bacterium]|nr:tetratricopeptide repeat protein [Myxococcota bacterium]